MLRQAVFVVALLISFQRAKLQPDSTTIRPKTDIQKVKETVNNINDLLGSLVNTVLVIMKDDLGQMKQDLSSLKASVNTLTASVENAQASVEDMATCACEHRNKTVDSDVNNETHVCGGTGGWRRVAYLNMTEPDAACPSGWQIPGFSNRMCGRVNISALSCDSVTFPVNGREYTSVCGKIRAYTYGGTDAFYAYHNGNVSTIDEAYVAGVSLTYGNYPRKHIWSFAAGLSEGNPSWPVACPCDSSMHLNIPSFVGNDYFCESGVNGPWGWVENFNSFHSDDPLWDGQNCLHNSTCCTLNNPPYFVKTLSAPTTDSIEARICLYDTSQWDDLAVEFLEFYVK